MMTMSHKFSTRGRRALWLAAFGIGASALIASHPASAQPAGCTVTTYTDPPRDELHCRDGLDVVAERATGYTLVENAKLGRPEAARLQGKALLVNFKPRRRGGGFQILTPYAIASVRGTTWAVDVTPERTSVFVRNGRVEVRRPNARSGVVLGAGEGVDVEAGDAPLQVIHWGAPRVAALLARFGR
jgi:ferric-dicitrate binding protein FerR (iron transport regulator)